MIRGWFITGTDTGVGKTEAALALMAAVQARGLRVVAMKPVASGAVTTGQGLRNEDALRLQQQASVRLAYERVNPYVFAPPIAPHLAAAVAGVTIDIAAIARDYGVLSSAADVTVVEGAGGWLVPLNARQTMADLAARLRLPVILVVGMRLGCLNQALLSAAAILQSGQQLAGWIANEMSPAMEFLAENVASLQQRLPAPLLGQMPYQPGAAPSLRGRCLNLECLLAARPA